MNVCTGINICQFNLQNVRNKRRGQSSISARYSPSLAMVRRSPSASHLPLQPLRCTHVISDIWILGSDESRGVQRAVSDRCIDLYRHGRKGRWRKGLFTITSFVDGFSHVVVAKNGRENRWRVASSRRWKEGKVKEKKSSGKVFQLKWKA